MTGGRAPARGPRRGPALRPAPGLTRCLASLALAFVALPFWAGCSLPDGERAEPLGPGEPHCWRCDRVWSAEATAAHERHLEERGLRMFASGCDFCRHHGAYKDQ